MFSACTLSPWPTESVPSAVLPFAVEKSVSPWGICSAARGSGPREQVCPSPKSHPRQGGLSMVLPHHFAPLREHGTQPVSGPQNLPVSDPTDRPSASLVAEPQRPSAPPGRRPGHPGVRSPAGPASPAALTTHVDRWSRPPCPAAEPEPEPGKVAPRPALSPSKSKPAALGRRFLWGTDGWPRGQGRAQPSRGCRCRWGSSLAEPHVPALVGERWRPSVGSLTHRLMLWGHFVNVNLGSSCRCKTDRESSLVSVCP